MYEKHRGYAWVNSRVWPSNEIGRRSDYRFVLSNMEKADKKIIGTGSRGAGGEHLDKETV